MLITPTDIEIYQHCPARWKLRKQFPIEEYKYSEYIQAIRKTIFSMYSWQMSSGRCMKLSSVRERWDQNWWLIESSKKKDRSQIQVFDTAANGWMIIQKYWANIYKEYPAIPVGINFLYTYQLDNLGFRIEYDIMLADKAGDITYIQLGKPITEWQLYTSLKTKLEVVCLADTIGKPPVHMKYIDVISRKQSYLEKIINIDDNYINQAKKIISMTASYMKDNVVYSSPSDSCKKCPAKGKCWY
jgi:hypothetical protein